MNADPYHHSHDQRGPKAPIDLDFGMVGPITSRTESISTYIIDKIYLTIMMKNTVALAISDFLGLNHSSSARTKSRVLLASDTFSLLDPILESLN